MAVDPPAGGSASNPSKEPDTIAARVAAAEPVAAPVTPPPENGDAVRIESELNDPALADDDRKKKRRRRRPRQKDSLVRLGERLTLWCTPDDQAIATIPVGDHFENRALRSGYVRRWLSGRAFEELCIAPSTQAIDDTLRVFEAQAWKGGMIQETWNRVGARGGKLYIDLCDADWQVIEIGPGGFEVIAGTRLPFMRSTRQRPLCKPEAGYTINEFRRFANVKTEDDFILTAGWLVGSLAPRGPYAGLFVYGEHGSGKTGFLSSIADLIDPAKPSTQGPPREERDLFASAHRRRLLALDNLSRIEAPLSDAICRLLSGSGFAARALHTDKDENSFDGARPLVANGIADVADRADLNDRAIIVRLATITERRRRPQSELEADWETAKPRIVGALCTALSAAMANFNSVALTSYSRNAELEKWVAAAEPGLGWEAGTFADAYRRNRLDSADTIFESDLVAMAILDFMERQGLQYWEGSATDLLGHLSSAASEATRSQRSWPKTNQGLGNAIARSTPILRTKNINIEKRHSGDRKIIIARTAERAG
jgi:putative DNA primase/helicase